jgi:hypothetical protein
MTLRSVSATQIKQHRSCALQWYLQRVEGWTMPQSASQALGEAIHKQVEDYLLEGTAPTLPSVENAMKKGYVPPTGGAYLVEEPKDYGMRMLCAEVPVKGRIDLLVPPLAGESLVKVVDWKSARSFRYVPEPDVLTRDVQGILYLKYAFENYPFATTGQFRHVYLLTKGTGSKKLDAEVVDRSFVDAQWAHIEQTVEQIKATATRSLPVVAQTQANLSHCSAYGGCSFRDRCPAASKGLIESMFEADATTGAGAGVTEGIDMTTLAEKLKARRAATQTVTTEVVVAEPPAPVRSETAPKSVVEEPEVKVTEPVVASIVPPDAPSGDLVPEKAEGVLPPERSEGIMATLARRRVAKAKVQPVEPVVILPEKDRFLAIAEAAGLVSESVVVTPEPVAAPVRQPDPDVVAAANTIREKWLAEGEKRPLSLYIDCYPEKAEFDSLHALEDEIAARTPSLLEHLRKTSPKDVPEGAMDLGEVLFGRGYSTLAASFALKPISGPYTVSTLGPASSKLLEVLLPKALYVVRGRR